jgi:hypothetical protein
MRGLSNIIEGCCPCDMTVSSTLSVRDVNKLLLEERKKGKWKFGKQFGTVGIAVLDAGVDLTNNALCQDNLKVWSTKRLQNNKKLTYIYIYQRIPIVMAH